MKKTRMNLAEILPLNTPLSVHIFPSYFCNFKCSYCLHSLSIPVLEKRNFKKQTMNIDTYRKVIDDLKEFPNKLKTIIFAGHGEPLTHNCIANMVKYAKDCSVADRVEIVTNASLLTNEMSDNLIEAGLDLLRVSIQGVTDEAYQSISGSNFKIKTIVDNLTYFDKNKKNTTVEIKIVDIAVKEDIEKQKFFEMFAPICDSATIEYLIPFIPEIDHSKLSSDMKKCKHGNDCSESKICSMPFYMMVVEPNGNVVPCCSSIVPYTYGNVLKTSMKDLWNSKQQNSFLYNQLTDISFNKVCLECSVPKYGLQIGDYLDDDKERLLKLYKEKINV